MKKEKQCANRAELNRVLEGHVHGQALAGKGRKVQVGWFLLERGKTTKNGVGCWGGYK